MNMIFNEPIKRHLRSNTLTGGTRRPKNKKINNTNGQGTDRSTTLMWDSLRVNNRTYPITPTQKMEQKIDEIARREHDQRQKVKEVIANERNAYNAFIRRNPPKYQMTDKFKTDHLLGDGRKRTTEEAVRASLDRLDENTRTHNGTYTWINLSENELLKRLNNADETDRIATTYDNSQQLKTVITAPCVTCKVEAITKQVRNEEGRLVDVKNGKYKLIDIGIEKNQKIAVVGDWLYKDQIALAYHYDSNANLGKNPNLTRPALTYITEKNTENNKNNNQKEDKETKPKKGQGIKHVKSNKYN